MLPTSKLVSLALQTQGTGIDADSGCAHASELLCSDVTLPTGFWSRIVLHMMELNRAHVILPTGFWSRIVVYMVEMNGAHVTMPTGFWSKVVLYTVELNAAHVLALRPFCPPLKWESRGRS